LTITFSKQVILAKSHAIAKTGLQLSAYFNDQQKVLVEHVLTS